jgi:hypothetical protein
MMTIPEKVVAFVRGGKAGAFCDDCIRMGLRLPRRQEGAIVTLTLSLGSEFSRNMGSCTSRGHVGSKEKLVIRAL